MECRCNDLIRTRAKEYNIKLWEIADKLGMSDTAFSKKLRKELSDSDRQYILLMLRHMKEERDAF